MGLEEHLLGMFSEDFEFNNATQASHLGGGNRPADIAVSTSQENESTAEATWDAEAEQALSRIPFFVRGKARRNTEAYARERGLPQITLETLYDAKAHFGR